MLELKTKEKIESLINYLKYGTVSGWKPTAEDIIDTLHLAINDNDEDYEDLISKINELENAQDDAEWNIKAAMDVSDSIYTESDYAIDIINKISSYFNTDKDIISKIDDDDALIPIRDLKVLQENIQELQSSVQKIKDYSSEIYDNLDSI